VPAGFLFLLLLHCPSPPFLLPFLPCQPLGPGEFLLWMEEWLGRAATRSMFPTELLSNLELSWGHMDELPSLLLPVLEEGSLF
jgi:hypothetical protein